MKNKSSLKQKNGNDDIIPIGIEINITSEKHDIDWLFEDNQEVLQKIKVLDKETENLIWNKLKDDSIIEDYDLNESKFETFESIEFRDNY